MTMRSITTLHSFQLLLLLIFSLTFLSSEGQSLDMSKFTNLKPRNIGPAGMSGRVTAIDVVHKNPQIIYVGTASGGLWKSTGGGTSWEPIFDGEKVSSIGAIAIDQNNPDIIYVGTGEGNPRNSQTSGNGVYKSIDGGKSWVHLGLDGTRNIHRIILHRDQPSTLFVAALGSAWGDSPNRGVFKSEDGGQSWQKVLFVNNRTGAADFVVDPNNPNKMMVNMWEYRRWPWFFKSGGDGSGLYVTLDGGKNWTKRTSVDGLPEGELGKIGLAIAPSNSQVVYALVEAKKNAIYRSEDGGLKWKKVAEKNIGDRPFYYADIAVDPQNENRLYNVYSNVSVSNDGGKTFESLLGWDRVHGDHHYWYVHPHDGNFIINGNDGGLAISRDRGISWRFVENLPLAQFYHIHVDNEIPYNIMCGMQDNGTWRGPSSVWRNGGIRNGYWEEIAFGDGFDVLTDTDNSRYGYGMWQGGNLLRLDFKTGASRYIKPTHPEGQFLRFNWNAAIAQDPFDSKVIYYASQFLHRSSDEGRTWELLSPDLTTNDPEKQKQARSGGLTYDVTGAENFTTIVSIAPSKKEPGVIWVGTDDGNIQLTRDGGKSWNNVRLNIKNFPVGSWVPQIQVSSQQPGEAFVVVNNYRRDDWTPYLYHTKDYGKSWQNLVNKDQVWGYTLCFVQDQQSPNLMFLGTEFGLYTSIDGGVNWNKWGKGYPTVSTMDMVIHPRDQDLVIGTFGRSAFVLDDIRPLKAVAEDAALLQQDLHVFEPSPAILAHYKQAAGTRFMADAIYRGDNKGFGALVSFWLKELTPNKDGTKITPVKSDTAQVEIRQNNLVIRNLKVPVTTGMNRFSWALDHKGVRMPSQKPPKKEVPEKGGAAVLPGTYEITIIYGELKASTTVQVVADPRLDIATNDLESSQKFIDRLIKNMELLTAGVDRLREAKSSMKEVSSKIPLSEIATKEQFKQQHIMLNEKLDSLWQLIIPAEETQGIYRDPALLSVKLSAIGSYFNGPFSPMTGTFGSPNPVFFAPSPMHEQALLRVESEISEAIKGINTFFKTDWPDYQNFVKEHQITLFKDYQPIGED